MRRIRNILIHVGLKVGLRISKTFEFGIDGRIKWILDLNSNIVSKLGLKLIFVKFLPAAP